MGRSDRIEGGRRVGWGFGEVGRAGEWEHVGPHEQELLSVEFLGWFDKLLPEVQEEEVYGALDGVFVELP